MALSASRRIIQFGDENLDVYRGLGIGTGVTIYHGAMVMLSAAGYVVPASTSSPTQAIGVADLEIWDDQTNINGQPVTTPSTWPNYINNTGANDARKCVVRAGDFVMNNKGGDLVTRAMIGGTVYIEDDQTVRATSSGSAAAGQLVGFTDGGLPIVRIFKA